MRCRPSRASTTTSTPIRNEPSDVDRQRAPGKAVPHDSASPRPRSDSAPTRRSRRRGRPGEVVEIMAACPSPACAGGCQPASLPLCAAQLGEIVQPLLQLALEPALDRRVVDAGASCRRENSSGRKSRPRRRGHRHSPRRSPAPSSARSARSGYAWAAAPTRSCLRRRAAPPCRRRSRRSISARARDRSPPAPAPVRPRASPAARRSPRPAGRRACACGSARPISSTAMRVIRRAR